MSSQEISEIESRISYLRERCDTLAHEFKECFAEAGRLRPSLEDVESEADEKAREMKRLFAEASEAYSSGDGESAKALSIEAREHKSRCEELNEEAQVLRDEIRSLAEEGKRKQADCESLNAEVARLIKKKRSLIDQSRSLSVSGNSLVVGDKIQIEKGRLEILARRFSNLPWDQARALQELLSNNKVDHIILAWGLSNPALNDDVATEIPEALADVFRSHPEVAGLFSPLSTRGPGVRHPRRSRWLDE